MVEESTADKSNMSALTYIRLTNLAGHNSVHIGAVQIVDLSHYVFSVFVYVQNHISAVGAQAKQSAQIHESAFSCSTKIVYHLIGVGTLDLDVGVADHSSTAHHCNAVYLVDNSIAVRYTHSSAHSGYGVGCLCAVEHPHDITILAFVFPLRSVEYALVDIDIFYGCALEHHSNQTAHCASAVIFDCVVDHEWLVLGSVVVGVRIVFDTELVVGNSRNNRRIYCARKTAYRNALGVDRVCATFKRYVHCHARIVQRYSCFVVNATEHTAHADCFGWGVVFYDSAICAVIDVECYVENIRFVCRCVVAVVVAFHDTCHVAYCKVGTASG